MSWLIVETNQCTLPAAERLGSKFLTGNGQIGYRGTLEEYTKPQKPATIVAGLYDQIGDQWREPVNLPNGGYVQIAVKTAGQEEWIHALTSKVVAHTQSLDIRRALHFRETLFETQDGIHVTVRARRFVSLVQPHLLCIEYSVHADRPCEIEIRSGVDGDVWDINGPHLLDLRCGEDAGILTVSAHTHEQGVPVAVSEALTLSTGIVPDAEIVELGDAAAMRLLRLAIDEAGVALCKFVAHRTGCDGAEGSAGPIESSRSLARTAAAHGFAALLAEHEAQWQTCWDACDVQIEGDSPAQQALRFSLYHLLAIVPRPGAGSEGSASIPARGLSGQMYKGAIFWDTEIFILPFFVHVFPELARNLLLYRCQTLPGARRKAAEYGFRGAYYAWESQDTGDDACTLFAVTDVFTNRPMRTYFRDKQVHISADIAYALGQYVRLTGDTSIWLDGGAEVLFECARFFLSYLYYKPERARYEVLDVTGPDEYHERVHNNTFTNRMVGHTFALCLQVAETLRADESTFYAELVARLDFAHDLQRIAENAPALYQPDVVAAGAIIPQFDGYHALEDLPLEALLARKLHPTEYLGGGIGLATTTQIIKQADVVLMLHLFSERYPLETKRSNWEFYEPRTEHGSSLSASAYSLVAAELGKIEWAYNYFMKTATIDLEGKGKQYVGTLYIGGTHPAANGGAWMSAVLGMCGIRWQGQRLVIQPRLPAHWSAVTVPLRVQGKSLRIRVTQDEVSVVPMQPLDTELAVVVDGEETRFVREGATAIAYSGRASRDSTP